MTSNLIHKSGRVGMAAAPLVWRTATLAVLSSIGIYLAASLSLAHLLQKALPCGASNGCAIVQASRLASFAGVPLAFVGLVYYFAVFLQAAASMTRGRFHLKELAPWVSLFAAIFSTGLTYFSYTRLHAVCTWCFASNCTAIGITIVYFLPWKDIVENSAAWPNARSGIGGLLVLIACGILQSLLALVHGLGPQPVDMHVLRRLNASELVSTDALSIGPDNAPLKLVVFVDLECGTCQDDLPKLYRMAQQNGFLLVVRNFPLREHPGAKKAALLAIIAASANEGWPFLLHACEQHLSTGEEFVQLARSMNLVPSTKPILAASKSLLALDMALGDRLKIQATPTLIALQTGLEPKAVDFSQLPNLLAATAKHAKLNVNELSSTPDLDSARVSVLPKKG